jgi:hypothetical protein
VGPTNLFEKYRSKGALLDTNLMLLLIVGAYDPRCIATFKRTMKYTKDDFTLITGVANYFQRRVITPNILTEVDNLARQLPERDHRALSSIFGRIISSFFELYVPSADAFRTPEFAQLGLTDVATILSTNDLLVITDDFRLSNRLLNAGRDAVNINHIRMLGWGIG